MMLKPVQAILHPPELKGKDRRRYWLAVVAWLFFMMMSLVLAGAAVGGIGYAIQSYYGEAFLNSYAVGILLVPFVIAIPIAILLSDNIWSHLFIHSGYLSDAATIRILSNRAPTRKSERRHRWFGQALMLVIYGGVGIWAILSEQWWMLVIVVPLGVWGIFLIRNAWKDADRMLEGGPIPPASEERIDYIEKVLDKRWQHNDRLSKGSENNSF